MYTDFTGYRDYTKWSLCIICMLYTGKIMWKLHPRTCKMWSGQVSGLNIQVVFRQGGQFQERILQVHKQNSVITLTGVYSDPKSTELCFQPMPQVTVQKVFLKGNPERIP